MLHVGLDFHQNSSSLCIMNNCGQILKNIRVPGRWPAVVKAIAQLPAPVSVAFEASGACGMLYEKLCEVAHHVTVAHPGALRLIYASRRKNDRIDAQKLAKLLYVDAIPAAHVPGAQVRQWRQLIELRRSLVKRQTALKNQLHAMLRNLGIASPRGLFTRKGRDWLLALQIDEASSLQRTILLEQLHQVHLQLRQLQRDLDRRGDADPRVALLQTVPGVGPRTAEAYLAYVDRVERFARVNRVSSYFGLVPCEDSSADRTRLGHITKQGPPTVRQLLCEAAWTAIAKDQGLKERFDRICNGDQDRRKIAIVAIANHLSRSMAAMLKTGETWRTK